MKSLLGLTIVLLCATPVYADLYKWVDAQGKTHYSDQPASGSVKSEKKLEIPNQPSVSALPENAKTWQDKELDYKKRQASAAEREVKKQKDAEEAKTKNENCDRAKEDLSRLENIAPVYTFDEKTGRSYLNEAQRTAAIANARKSIMEWCK